MPGLKLTSKSCILSQILFIKLFQADLCSHWCLSNHSSVFEQCQILLNRAWSCWWTWGGSWTCCSPRPNWGWRWAGESAGTVSELIWQHKWKWEPNQLWEPPELSGYLWPPQWPNQPVVTTPLQSLPGSLQRCQGSTWPEPPPGQKSKAHTDSCLPVTLNYSWCREVFTCCNYPWSAKYLQDLRSLEKAN